jgi:hypothetical protein
MRNEWNAQARQLSFSSWTLGSCVLTYLLKFTCFRLYSAPGERIVRAEGPCPFFSHIRTTSCGVGSHTGKFDFLTLSGAYYVLQGRWSSTDYGVIRARSVAPGLRFQNRRPPKSYAPFRKCPFCQIWTRFGRAGFETGATERALRKMNMEKCETHRRMCSAEEPEWAKGRSDGEADTRKNGRL